MEEELNENELEERFYSMLHYVDETQAGVNANKDGFSLLESAPRSTVRRYWRDTTNIQNENNPYQKINTPKETLKQPPKPTPDDKTKPKEEKHEETPQEALPIHLSIFQAPVPQNLKDSIEIIENEGEDVVELQSSDEDEVIEVALPPKPTITIESSDEEEHVSPTPTEKETKPAVPEKPPTTGEREVSSSPVPSVVSSVSDEFIRSDCIALNISSRHPANHSFDFSLHDADLLSQSTPTKKKKKKKSKEATSTPVVVDLTPNKTTNTIEECFATPKSKVKNKRQRTKSYTVSEKSIPNPDVYDSDSNQSVIDISKTQNSYTITDTSLLSNDTYESDSTEHVHPNDIDQPSELVMDSSDSSSDKGEQISKNPKRNSINQVNETYVTVDLTDNAVLDNTNIQENIVIGNVSGFSEPEDYNDERIPPSDGTKYGSTKVPAILYENLDFDNLKGKDKVCKNRRYSLTTLRAEMEKFYNESWGGEDFNHREIQKNMSRDKSLWAIDPKDRMPSLPRKKPTCNYCNRPGHRDDTCRLKPAVCYMCGSTGHIEPRCPSKICVNCGSPNHVYSTMCRNCCTWGRITCAECGQNGHPSSHCPDMWRRYHNTIDFTMQLEQSHYTKKHYQLFCSGCTRRGHLVHTCRLSLPFSGLPINSPYVQLYRPVYTPAPEQDNTQYTQKQRQPHFKNIPQDSTVSSATFRSDRNKRQSKSPTVHDSHTNKKRNVTPAQTGDTQHPRPANHGPQRKISLSKEPTDDSEKVKETDKNVVSADINAEKAPDFIPIVSTNHDKKGQMIQDNEVSDTSDVVTSARIYVTNEIIDKLKTKEGEDWLKETTGKYDVTIQNTEITSFLSIKGKLADQETFQSALRDWAKLKSNKEHLKSDIEADISQESENEKSYLSNNIPKNRNNVLRKLNKALDSLKEDLGEPNLIYKELTYLQNRHQQLLKQKVINPKQLSNNKDHMNEMMKKLNMVLLGQAGLADGSKHVTELYSLQEKLINFRQKNIPIDLRKEIGQHYHCIFTAIPRDDYGELLKCYYGSKQPASFKKKKKEKPFKVSPKKKKFNTIPSQQKNRCPGNETIGDGEIVESKSPHLRKPLVEKTMNKLVFYHKRLLKARPIDSVLKKTRVELVRKLHSHIASLGRNANMSSKTLKKMRKIQERAQLFLSNV